MKRLVCALLIFVAASWLGGSVVHAEEETIQQKAEKVAQDAAVKINQKIDELQAAQKQKTDGKKKDKKTDNDGPKKPLMERVEHKFADSNGVKIHYATIGKGPLIVMIHGFPDFWYSWRNQMEALSKDFKCAAIDLRGYNMSDKPKGLDNYAMPLLVGDVLSVIKAEGQEKAIVLAHDWGGAIAWQVAMNAPEHVDKLIICNLPHLRGVQRELAHNPEQQKNSGYARAFQKEGAEKNLTAIGLASMHGKGDAAIKAEYQKAFENSDFEAMLNYYKKNYPREPYQDDTSPVIKVKAPVLMFHGLKDTALNAAGLNGTWDWVDQDLTIVTVPNAGHWVQHDAADLVSSTIKWWLLARK